MFSALGRRLLILALIAGGCARTEGPFKTNLILGGKVVPELFQEQATPRRLAQELSRYLDDRRYFQSTRSELMKLRERLCMGGATRRVAEILEPYLAPGQMRASGALSSNG